MCMERHLFRILSAAGCFNFRDDVFCLGDKSLQDNKLCLAVTAKYCGQRFF